MSQPAFDAIAASPMNEIFRVVFYPDRIYHARYLNSTRSSRYRYKVSEVRSYLDITVMKAELFLDGVFYCNVLRVEYGGSRLVEVCREKGRIHREQYMAWIKLNQETAPQEATTMLHYCPWTDTYQVELWETLEAPPTNFHDIQVLDQMGHNGSITCIPKFKEILKNLKSLKTLELAFRETDTQLPAGWPVQQADIQWDNNLLKSHQVPVKPEPSSSENTIPDQNYLLNFQRGWYLQTQNIKPVRYKNAMMDAENPEKGDNNIVDMRWIVQRELGGSTVFFHEVTVPPHVVEGTHQHIGTEELYYIVEGTGTAYMRDGDDPSTDKFNLVERHVMGIGPKLCRALPVKPGSVIYTKSGGIHGIRNDSDKPLKFVAFLYHTT
jgi:oxalate decarboxylase/phosphoglucose isomerase-like protein (cupin superfamily)